jgi:hypothetical protein
MTGEHRLLIEPSDVLSLELCCKICGATLGKKPSQSPLPPKRNCHNCNEELLPQESTLSSAVKGLSHSLSVLSEMQTEAKFTLRLHVAEPTHGDETRSVKIKEK